MLPGGRKPHRPSTWTCIPTAEESGLNPAQCQFESDQVYREEEHVLAESVGGHSGEREEEL